MLEQGVRSDSALGADRGEVRYMRSTALRMLIEGAVMTEVHLQQSNRTDRSSTLDADLRAVCDEAKRIDLRAEQLLVVLKGVWYSIPAAQAHELPADARSLLSRLVTMIVDEYYRSPLAD